MCGPNTRRGLACSATMKTALDYQDAVAVRLHSLFTCNVAGLPPPVVSDQCLWSEALEADLVRTSEKMAAAWRLQSQRTVSLLGAAVELMSP